MPYVTRSRPPSPSGTSRIGQGQVDGRFSSNDPSATPGPAYAPTSTPVSELRDFADMLLRDKEKPQPTLDIVVTNDVLHLKGLGTEAESALLSGHVVIYLPEATSIKDIALHFRGKARLSPPVNES